jgi:hypothetical protein
MIDAYWSQLKRTASGAACVLATLLGGCDCQAILCVSRVEVRVSSATATGLVNVTVMTGGQTDRSFSCPLLAAGAVCSEIFYGFAPRVLTVQAVTGSVTTTQTISPRYHDTRAGCSECIAGVATMML